ncbi:MAG TPA: HEAT repeat domain-containing protein [Candidatus Aminicenantes bacterium]|nr:HEAT repeat domain-containing protein [Candidatus Aminicenantes bacterium]HRY63945.1 HEAT repeat domain-containing protein [Candidatus Aminicenantes bacterium]HRZ70858.1 HEAT repeat domain-containing protein [Candidatus Aminicenantes bacterium]
MTCEKIQEKYADYLTGDLDEAGRAEVQAHILGCQACREDLENLTVVWAKLGVLPEEQPGGAVRARFYALLEDEKRKAAAAAVPQARSRLADWLTFRRPAFAASFSVLLLLLGLGAGWFLSAGRPGRESYAALSREVQDMRQQVALSLLNDPSASERIQGVGYTAEVKDPSDTTLAALFKAVDADPNPNVRLAAVDALYLFRDRPGVRQNLVRSLSVQSYPLVQVALIDFLVEVREARAVEALKKLIEAGELTPDVKKRAEQGLRQIAL